MSSDYNQYWYWENMVLSEKPLWSNSFKNLNLTRDSVFVYSLIMCKERGILKNNWAYYPNLESLVGFIEHVFMPTAFFTWLDDEYEFKVPVATSAEVLDVMSMGYENNKEIDSMWKDIESIHKVWMADSSCCLDKLRKFSNSFNERWKINDEKLLYFRIFENSREIADFVFLGENEDVFEEVIEEDIGMTKKQWYEICENVYDNKFLSKRFVDILNNKVGCLV